MILTLFLNCFITDGMNEYIIDSRIKNKENEMLAPNLEICRQFYGNLLYDKKNRLHDIKNHYELKRKFEYEFDKDLSSIFEESVEESYKIFFSQNPTYAKINKKYKIVYSPYDKIVESKYKYRFGVDKHLFGMNIIGKTLEKLYYGWDPKFNKNWIFIIFHCIKFSINELYSGKDILYLNSKSPMEILKSFVSDVDKFMNKSDIDKLYEKFVDKSIEYYDIIMFEFHYPGNLIYYIRKIFSPFINFNLDYQIKNLLFQEIIYQMEKQSNMIFDIYSTPIDDCVYHKILQLYSMKKISLTDDKKQKCESLIMGMWPDQKVIESLSFIPNNMKNIEQNDMFIFSENNEPVSPLYPQSNLNYKGLVFPTIMHLIYFKIFYKLGMNKDKIYKILCKNQKYINFYACDVDYQIDLFILKKSKKEFFNIFFKPKKNELNFIRTIIKLLNYPKIKLIIPYDNFLTSQDHFNFYQDMIIMFYSKISQSLNQEILSNLKMLISITENYEKLEILQRYFLHMFHSFNIIFKDLGWEPTLQNIKNAIKIIYPSIYVMYKAKGKHSREKNDKFVMNKMFNEESNEFIYSLIYTIYELFDESIQYSLQSKIRPHDEDSIIKKVGHLFYFTEQKNAETIVKIGHLLGNSIFDIHKCYKDEKTCKKVKKYTKNIDNEDEIMNNMVSLIKQLQFCTSYQDF